MHTYGNTQHRAHGDQVSADVTCLLTPEQIKTMSVDEINEAVRKALTYDEYKYQKENGILIKETYRAEGLHKILYQCPHCLTEHKMASEGADIFCTECNKRWHLNEDGTLTATEGETESPATGCNSAVGMSIAAVVMAMAVAVALKRKD